MNIDKVIEILDSGKAPETEQDFEDFDTAIETAINLLKTHPDNQPNDPLTPEQLREMDGEPVWCVDGRGNQCWCLVNCDDGLPCCYDNETGLWEDCFYGMTGDGRFGLHQSGWLAYRSKPEEGTNAVT